MILHRRNFLIGLVSVFAAPAIVRAENIMPVRALILPPPDPLVRGIRWQSWPFNTPYPINNFAEGSIDVERGDGVAKPLSHFMKRMEWHEKIWPDLVWKPIPALNIHKRGEK